MLGAILDGFEFVFYQSFEPRLLFLEHGKFFHFLPEFLFGSTICFEKSVVLILYRFVISLNLLEFPLGGFLLVIEIVALLRKKAELVLDRVSRNQVIEILLRRFLWMLPLLIVLEVLSSVAITLAMASIAIFAVPKREGGFHLAKAPWMIEIRGARLNAIQQ